MGRWEIPLQLPAKFHAPSDPGCGGRALMHAGAERKAFVERFRFRAPEAGSGSLIFRCLIKQGETNRGAFYWVSRPGGSEGAPPTAGAAGGDLVVHERSGPSPPGTSHSAELRDRESTDGGRPQERKSAGKLGTRALYVFMNPGQA